MKTPAFLRSPLLACLVATPILQTQAAGPIAPGAGVAIEQSDGLAASGLSGMALARSTNAHVFFLSTAGNLTTNDLNRGMVDLYRHDLRTGVTRLVSGRAADGLAANGPVTAYSTSIDGRWAAFSSRASNLVPDDANPLEDVFLKDLDAGSVLWLSRAANGTAANAESRVPILSASGDHVLFESAASNLGTGTDTNRTTDIFLWERTTGTVRRLSSTATGAAGGSGSSSGLLAPDGNTAVFRNTGSDLASLTGPAPTDLVVWSRDTNRLWRVMLPGVTPPAGSLPLLVQNPVLSADGNILTFRIPNTTTTVAAHEGLWRVNLATRTAQRISGSLFVGTLSAPARTHTPSLSADGARVAFTARATATGPDQVRIWDSIGGLTTLDERRDTPEPGTEEPAFSYAPLLSPDGTRLAFETHVEVPAAGVASPGGGRLYLRELGTGRMTTPAPDRLPEPVLANATFTPDSQALAFDAFEPFAGAEDNNGTVDVYLATDGFDDIRLLSRRHTDLANRTGDAPGRVERGALSDDGRFIAFTTSAANLAPDDTNRRRDIFVSNLTDGTRVLVSVGLDGKPASGDSRQPRLSASGTRVAFVSTATNLIADDALPLPAVFVRDLVAGTTVLASAPDGLSTKGTWSARSPEISADGDWVLFESLANDLVPGVTSTTLKLFLRHLPTQRTYLVSGNLLPASPTETFEGFGARISADGSWVAFLSRSGAYLYSRDSGARQPAAPGILVSSVSLSRDGSRLALLGFATSAAERNAIYWRDVGNTNLTLALAASTRPGESRMANLSLSGNGQVLAFDSPLVVDGPHDTNGTNDVFVFDIPSSTLTRISNTAGSPAAASGSSDAPTLSHDGRRIAFRSTATDLVPGDLNGHPDVFLHDRDTGSTRLLSQRPDDSGPGNGPSFRPWISPDGQRVAFESRASDLVPQDHNQLDDVFVATATPVVRVSFEPLPQGPDARLRWNLTGPAGARVVIQSSRNLQDWTPLGTNLLPAAVELLPETQDGPLLLRALQEP